MELTDTALESSRTNCRTISLQEGYIKIEVIAKSEQFRRLSSKYGKKPDGEDRIQVVANPLIHHSKYAKKIKLGGFDPAKRNPVILGFCFIHEWDEDRYDLGELKDYDKIRVFILGPVWNPCGNGEAQPDIMWGWSSDLKWNLLVEEVAKEAGLKLPWPLKMNDKFWEARERFADIMRQRLLIEGIVSVQVGGELEVIDTQAIYIIEDK